MSTKTETVELRPSFSKNRRQNIDRMAEQLRKSPLKEKALAFETIATSTEQRQLAEANGKHILQWAAEKVGATVHWVK